MEKKKLLTIIIGMIFLLLILLGASYAYWLVTRTQTETNDFASLKCLNITLTDETEAIKIQEDYAVTNEEGMGREPYSFTVTNACTTAVSFDISLEVLNSTTIAHQYIRASLNDVGNNIDKSKVLTGFQIKEASIAGATSYLLNSMIILGGSASKTYDLRLWIDEATTADQGMNKTFDSKITITAVPIKLPLVDAILIQEGGAEAIESKGTPNFTAIAASTDTGLYAALDDYGTSYYFRGEKDLLNNNIIFAGFQWKIIRINGNGSIRIIYNGICPDNNCVINSIGAATQIAGTHPWNTDNSDDAKYVGYMYGGPNGSASTCRNSPGCATDNAIANNAKVKLELWYANNIVSQGAHITSKIVDGLFCNDRQLQSEVGGSATGPGYGNSTSNYAPNYRLMTNRTPNLKCNQQNDRFTSNDIIIGNGALEYPVGLITADEASMAGLVYNLTNSTNYLYTNLSYWTLSPTVFNGTNAGIWVVYPDGGLLRSVGVSGGRGLRPTLNLSSETKVTGEGTTSNPYKVTN